MLRSDFVKLGSICEIVIDAIRYKIYFFNFFSVPVAMSTESRMLMSVCFRNSPVLSGAVPKLVEI